MIAYVKTGASVEQDVVDQLRSLFKFQRQLTSGLAGLDILGLTKNLFDQDAITGVIREDELTEIAS